MQSWYDTGLLLSVDWFQPFKHVQYSIGAIYLVLLNLPRSLKYLRKNMILAGIICLLASMVSKEEFEQLVSKVLTLQQRVEQLEQQQKEYASIITFCTDVFAITDWLNFNAMLALLKLAQPSVQGYCYIPINSFLEQLVSELNKLWKGVEIQTNEGKNTFLQQ